MPMHPTGNLFVAAVDFWSPSLNALEMAARFAKQYNGRVLAIHVIEKSFQYPEDITVDADTIEEDLQNHLQNLLQSIARQGIPVELEIREGNMSRQLSQALHDHEAAAVFVGIREGRILEDIFIGTNTLQLLKSAEIPVVIVDSLPSETEIQAVMIPFDPSTGIDGLLDFMAKSPQALAKSVMLVVGLGIDDNEENVMAKANQAADKLESMGFLRIDIQVVRDENPFAGMLHEMKQQSDGYDLVLLEQPNLAAKGQFTLGSFVEEVVTKARMPVFCLPIRRH
jgi:nucleotide-binding universal stress UspA family protein